MQVLIAVYTYMYFHKLMKHTLSLRFKLTVCVVS